MFNPNLLFAAAIAFLSVGLTGCNLYKPAPELSLEGGPLAPIEATGQREERRLGEGPERDFTHRFDQPGTVPKPELVPERKQVHTDRSGETQTTNAPGSSNTSPNGSGNPFGTGGKPISPPFRPND